MAFQKATKKHAKLKIALTGPSGSGKTFSALRLAQGLGGRCAVIDTENGSASLYADAFPGWTFDVDEIKPPYTVQKYLEAIEAAVKMKYDVLIIDSLTHAWAGPGGLLEQKEALDSRGGNSYTNWGSITKLHEKLKSWILHAPLDLVVTMRSKQDYVIETNANGKQAPKKVGLAPVMRDGMEYEFTVVFDIGMDHQFIVSKDRTKLFDGHVSTVTEDTGKTLNDWRGNPPAEEPPDDLTEKTDGTEVPPENRTPATRSIKNHATGETKTVQDQKAPPKKKKGPQAEVPPARTPAETFHPGDYVLPFSKNHKGLKFREIPLNDLRAYHVWAKTLDRPGPSVVEFMRYFDDYMTVLTAENEERKQIGDMKSAAQEVRA